MRISINPGAGMTISDCEILESYLRPDSCVPVLCVPPSLGPCGLLSQPLSVGLFHSFLCKLGFYSSKKSSSQSGHDLSDHGLNMKTKIHRRRNLIGQSSANGVPPLSRCPSLFQQGLFRCISMASGTIPVDGKVFLREGDTDRQAHWLTCLLLGKT